MNEFYVKGLENCKNEQFEEAIVNFNKALLMNPLHLECLYNRGMAKFRLAQYLAAIQDFDEALKIAPNNADIWSQRGVAKHLMGNSETGLEDLNKAQALEPKNAYRYSSRAFIRAKVGDVFGAQEDYKKALALDPEDAVAWNNLGLLEEAIGYKDSAQNRFKKADSIADEGKTFDKPDLDEIIQSAKEKEPKVSTASKRAEDKALKQNPKTEESTTLKTSNTAPSVKDYARVVKEIFTSKEVFNDFVRYAKEKFLFKKNKS